MKKAFGILSIFFSVFIILLFLVAPDVNVVGNYIYQWIAASFGLAILFAILSQKGVMRKTAFAGVFSIIGLFVLFQVIMTIIWNQP